MNESVSVTSGDLIGLRSAGEGLGTPLARVRAAQAGTYLSRYKGRGMEFEEHRPYQPGDDVRNIDWRVTARTGRPHTKVYREERERPVLFCVDYRRSMHFATRGAFKSVVAARAAALLAWSSSHHGDRVGGLVFSETRHVEFRPRRGKAAVLRLIQALVGEHDPQARVAPASSMDTAMARLRHVARPGSLVCIVSDFRGLGALSEAHLLQVARHSTVWLLFIADPIEMELPAHGVYRVSDGSKHALIDTRGAAARRAYARRFHDRRDRMAALCRSHGMSLIPIGTQDAVVAVLRNELVARSAA